ncbi:MAG: ABC transporter permease [Chloroflexi bacterium]|nr:ABC transporter permease [Chloroflexota bacterium]
MGALVIRRILQVPIALFGVLLVVYVLLLSTGDPVLVLLPPDATPQVIAETRKEYGLDKPLYQQFAIFLSKAVRGDFGNSIFKGGEPAVRLVLTRLPATAELALAALLLSGTFGLALGTVAALRRGTLIDQLVMVLATAGQSVANFWLGLMLMWVFAVWLRWLPPAGRDEPFAIVLPAIALGAHSVALLARLTRSGLLEVLGEDYIRTAHAKGLSPRAVVGRHAFRNALVPIVTVVGLNVGWLLGGTVAIEVVFAWPGVGSLLMESVLRRDYPVVLAGITYMASLFILINLVVDMLYAYIDPRIRYANR